MTGPSKRVTEDQFRLAVAIKASGLSARQYAKQVLLRDERTVRRWLAGEQAIPQAVIDFLQGRAQ